MPLLSLGLALAAFQFLPGGIWYLCGCYLIVVTGFGAGWAQGFPRWSCPYIGLLLFFAGWWVEVGKAVHWILAVDAGLALLTVALIVVAWTRSAHPWRQLFRRLWLDWTRISFGLYGAAPIVLWMWLGGVVWVPWLLCWGPAILALAAGALLYQRSTRPLLRVLDLLAGLTVSWAVAMVGVSIYWQNQRELGMVQAGESAVQIQGMALAGAMLVVLVLAPVLLELVRRMANSIRNRRPAEPGSPASQ